MPTRSPEPTATVSPDPTATVFPDPTATVSPGPTPTATAHHVAQPLVNRDLHADAWPAGRLR